MLVDEVAVVICLVQYASYEIFLVLAEHLEARLARFDLDSIRILVVVLGADRSRPSISKGCLGQIGIICEALYAAGRALQLILIYLGLILNFVSQWALLLNGGRIGVFRHLHQVK